MGSRSAKDGESPSTSTSLLPQIRASRRGSFASTSSNTQPDKEILSQALDQIHTTASQSETLTTFNEYTSPPTSSSGLESKGITSEIQGGISGLYTRFRASVESVKDIVSLAGEDPVVEGTSVKRPRAAIQSPAPSNKSISESLRAPFNTGRTHASTPGSEQQSPVGTKFNDVIPAEKDGNAKSSKGSAGSTSVSSKSMSSSLATLKSPPANLTQVSLPTIISPALAEVNISAIKQPGVFEPQTSDSRSNVNLPFTDAGRNAPARGIDGDSAVGAAVVVSHKALPGTRALEASRDGVPKSRTDNPGQRRGNESLVHQEKLPSDREAFSVEGEGNTDHALASSTQGKVPENERVRNITIETNAQDDIFQSPDQPDEPPPAIHQPLKPDHQHLELPAKKGLAPPPATASASPTSSISRDSSSETNGDGLTNPPLSREVEPGSIKRADRSQPKSTIVSPTISAPAHALDPKTMNVPSQVKNKVLNKQYWMKDENAKDCFYCGDPFSTFRRKHHCRTCGQIFDSKCTSLISGTHFGQSGSLRVCKPCESIINGEDDSSEFSDDGNLSIRGSRQRHGSTGASDVLVTPFSSSSPSKPKTVYRSSKHPDLTVPKMSIPATRKVAGESSQRPTVLEIDAERSLMRPSSSRSLRSAVGNKSFHSAHRRHNSRHHLQRGFNAISEDSAPFHQDALDEKRRSTQLPAFHDDNIIDPDLAPYLSDEGSSGDDQMSIMAALHGGDLSRSYDNDRPGLSGLVASSNKARSKVGDKSIGSTAFASRDGDNQSLSSFKTGNFPRSSKRRNLNVTSNVHLRPSPRAYRPSPAIPIYSTYLHESTSSSTLAQNMASSSPVGGSRMIRSSSMRGAAAPAIELNNASLDHVRKLLHQLLKTTDVPNVAHWEKALIPILLRATDDVDPDVQNGDDIDIRNYVKLKKVPGGRPGDTSYVSGLVFTKNLALKCMPRSIPHPNILILSFALEYSRHQTHFMSLEPVIRQEREFLENLVNRIAAMRPQLLLVERNVSGLALEFLQKANIATAYNVKASVLEAVSRCCQTRIISSIDKLAVKPAQVGKCANFYLKTYIHGGRRKTYMFLSGCAKELGCTIVLRGDGDATLAKMKRITEFMIYVVYNLKLETCLMRDEFAAIPSTTDLYTVSSAKDSTQKPFQGLFANQAQDKERQTNIGSQGVARGATLVNGENRNSAVSKSQELETPEAKKEKPGLPEEDSVPDDIPMPTFYGDMVEEHKTKILSASPFVKFVQPYLLMRAREQERRLAYLKRLKDQDIKEMNIVDEKAKPQKFDLITPEMVHGKVQTASRKVREVLRAVHDAEYDKALYTYQTQSKQWETHIAASINLFDPYAHQNIAVLYSLVCTTTTVPCSGPDILAFDFYNENDGDADFEADCTLGQYVEDLCLGATTVCTANGCEKKLLDHHRQYVHGEAQLSVFVEQYPCKLRGLQDTILMWSICRKCNKETQVLPMSGSTWKYSFGKYLELSFWSSELHARADVCPHDLHRDHLRYFGFKDMALRVHYDPITLVEIIVPRARITWKVDNDLRFKNDLFSKIEGRLNKFMLSVKARIKGINTDSVLPEKVDSCKNELEKLLKRASEEHVALIQKLRDNYMNSKHYEIIPLNRAIRAVQEKAAEWDNAFADFDRDFFPSEKDIRRLATLQLKKIFLDRDDSIAPLDPVDGGIVEKTPTEKLSLDDTTALSPQTRGMSPEKAHDMLAAVVEKHVSADENPDQHSAPVAAVPITESEPTWSPLQQVEKKEVRHLDLALPSILPKDLEHDNNVIARQTIPAVESEREPPQPEKTATAASRNLGPKTDDATVVRTDKCPSKESGTIQASGIPRPVDVSQRKAGGRLSPILSRAHTQPIHMGHSKTNSSSSQLSTVMLQASSPEDQLTKPGKNGFEAIANLSTQVDNSMPDRVGVGVHKPSGITAHSMIPRSITSYRKDSKVSNLAKHFEQLSKEFEKERIRERRQRAATSRQARAYPMAASKPIVHIYRNVHEAVEEKEPSDEYLLSSDRSADNQGSLNTVARMTESTASQNPGDDGFHQEDTTAENTETDENNIDSKTDSDAEGEGEGDRSDGDGSLLEGVQIPGETDDIPVLSEEGQLDVKLDLPKHEKSSLMKMLTKFWAERSASGWQPLEYPSKATDHIFADSDIIVREDEPSSLIAFALGSKDYQAKLRSIITSEETPVDTDNQTEPRSSILAEDRTDTEQSILRPTGKHLKYQFSEGSAKMLCKVFYAEQFDALRRKCGVSERIVESLSRCMKWDSKGGKTKSVFLKTLDDRFVLKSLSPIETQAFLQFAPGYFFVMSRFLFHDMPSVIAKMLGFFQITIKNPATGVDFNWTLLVMENLFYDRSPTRTFDLKGSMRNRRIQSTGEQNEVLLDENMVDFIYATPLFSREHSKRLLRASVYNDTLFLAKQNVMDYSLMVAVDEERKELVVGIIDCIRTYTWDKKLETWIKERGKNRPTVTSPKEYKSRFREAMSRYVLQAPNCWHQVRAPLVETRAGRGDEQGDDREVQVHGL